MPPRFLIDFSIAADDFRQSAQRAGADAVAQPVTRKISMISAIRPFMNGELPISSPVSGLRSGAPDGIVSRQKTTIRPISPSPAKRNPRDSCSDKRCALIGRRAVGRQCGIVFAQARLDHAIGDERDDHRQEQHRHDGEPDVRRQADRTVGVDEMGGVVGELDEDSIERLDQHVDGEGAGHGGKAERQAGERMTPDRQIGDAGERDQDQIARIRSDARQDTDKGQDIGQRPCRRHDDELADQRRDQAQILPPRRRRSSLRSSVRPR